MGEQPWPGTSARDRVRRRRRLRDLLAGPARELLAHVLDHLPLARDELQRLGHVFPDVGQNTAPARPGSRPRIDAALARASRHAACAATSIAFRVSTSSGRESFALIT